MRCARGVHRCWLRAMLVTGAALGIGAAPAAAQGPRLTGALDPGEQSTPGWPSPHVGGDPSGGPERPHATPGRAFLASLVLPGAGQALLGEGRWVLYGALEAWSWARYLDRSARGRELAREYRDLAREVARRVSSGERPEGTFTYYESLTHFGASGAYDLSPDLPGLQPETDPETHNGRIWVLARAIYLPGGEGEPGSPGYEQALDYYRENAVTPEFAWAWGANGLEQQVYQELIRGSDEAVRDATSMLGIILANHLLSGIDALITARLRAAGANRPARLRGGFDPLTDRWSILLDIPAPGR